MKSENPIREKVYHLLVHSAMTEAEIAKALKIGRATCHEHARVIYREAKVSSRLALVLKHHGIKAVKPKTR
jgi:DNA-binding NarL/FixJ family response regulator